MLARQLDDRFHDFREKGYDFLNNLAICYPISSRFVVIPLAITEFLLHVAYPLAVVVHNMGYAVINLIGVLFLANNCSVKDIVWSVHFILWDGGAAIMTIPLLVITEVYQIFMSLFRPTQVRPFLSCYEKDERLVSYTFSSEKMPSVPGGM